MPIPKLGPQDAGDVARELINGNFAIIDTILNAIGDVQTELGQIEARLTAETNDRMQAIALAIAAATTKVAGPGACPVAFARTALGLIDASTPLNPANVVATSLGQAYGLDGAGLIAPRATIAWDPDAIWIVQVRFWRLTDVLDPNNNAVDLGIQWLGPASEDVGTTLLHRETDLKVQDGSRTLTFRVPSEIGRAPLIQSPKTAVSWRPYLRTYGADGATAIERLGATDATFTGVYAPDVQALAARLVTLEGQVAAGPSAQGVQQAVVSALTSLPTVPPSTSGQPWRNGDFVAIT